MMLSCGNKVVDSPVSKIIRHSLEGAVQGFKYTKLSQPETLKECEHRMKEGLKSEL